MKNFFEKINDLLYDSVDYIIMMGIIVLVVIIIAWRLDLLFSNDLPDIASTDIIMEDNIENEVGDEEALNPIGEEETDKKELEGVLNVSIPSGSTSNSIGIILESNGLVSNKDDFISKCEELELSNKLKAGNYEIESGSSLETILAILTK